MALGEHRAWGKNSEWTAAVKTLIDHWCLFPVLYLPSSPSSFLAPLFYPLYVSLAAALPISGD